MWREEQMEDLFAKASAFRLSAHWLSAEESERATLGGGSFFFFLFVFFFCVCVCVFC